ncbi:hypothetical protein EMIHUDRAFT_226438 [Emiliania huxleyi CCMP1516]|uniref:Uncharacterized protein n=2 Tax=Emiliania huxleyi TaxID=2903 RepID=A0A0D3KKW5_EMIH1|nr:hypothetical protein EMIHUDRAFT_226438 [Emiliania huxleyi CCMP1516]EOD36400.1 hypothetical protein EMIHUDRAFT_226438 [Emiliania huxleyi CCMP1516]|eukprot:XP_005788829.1 hypothetical protein EMIHUDRAFT_226438 [Emiliania huxleyi CCMP1516]
MTLTADTTLYLHYEESSPEFTMKCTVGGEALGAAAVLERFAHAYSKQTGSPLAPGGLHLRDSRGAAIACGALLPCGLSNGADLFVSEGSAIASSQARMGEHSYYYSVGKAGDPERPPVPQPQRTCVERVAAGAPEATISSFSFEDTDALVKLHIPLAGAGSLPAGAASSLSPPLPARSLSPLTPRCRHRRAGAIRCDVRHRSFDLRVTTAGRLLRLHVRALRPRRCTASRAGEGSTTSTPSDHMAVFGKTMGEGGMAGKLLLVLAKAEAKQWFELRKSKGVGDTEFLKLVPDSGETRTIIV